MIKIKNIYYIGVIYILFLISSSVLSDTDGIYNNHNFKFINNSGETIRISVESTTDNWFHQAYIFTQHQNKSSTSEIIPPYSSSKTIIIQNGKETHYSLPQSKGIITLSKAGAAPGKCTYAYTYKTTKSLLSIFKKHSIFFQEPVCSGSLSTNQLTVISEEVQALSRDVVNKGFHILPVKPTKYPGMIAQDECGEAGVNNCIIFSPNAIDSENNKSTLWQSLYLQADINHREPLNFEQFIGTHNAAISSHYTSRSSHLDLSNIDPNQFVTLTDMLNAGVRHIELDILWNGKNIIVCHDHVSSVVIPVLCQFNPTLTGSNPKERYPLIEIEKWLQKNKDALIIIYLDINRPIDKHLDSLHKDLKTLQKYIFTPEMAQHIFGVKGNGFPSDRISAHDIVDKYNKNIFVMSDDYPYLDGDPYIFTNNKGWKSIRVQQASKLSSMRDMRNKYETVRESFKDTDQHRGLFRVYSDRSALGFLGEKAPPGTLNYVYTAINSRQLTRYPINIFAADMWGFTCNSSQCMTHPADPRLHAMLWSWDVGYPITRGAGKLAYISATTHRFQNKKIEENKTYKILCVRNPSIAMRSPTEVLQWFTVSKKISKMEMADSNRLFTTFETLCSSSGGTFAAPVTSYWMNDVVDLLVEKSDHDIIINYRYINNKWVPNSNRSIVQYLDHL